jgi:nucleoside phosphorylase
MTSRVGRAVSVGVLSIVCVLAPSVAAAARVPGLCDAVSTDPNAPAIMVFGAFPAELVALVAATDVDATVELDGRQYYRGNLRGVRVILGLTGIGVVNAFDRTTSVINGFELAGIVFSGVAGTSYNIGDVVVCDDWVQTGVRGTWHPNDALVALARRANDPLPAPLERCTLVPPGSPTAQVVCMPNELEVVFGGKGESGDPYDGATGCQPNSTDILGCDLPPLASVAAARNDEPAVIQDMETTAVARAAKEGKIPFLGIRSGSDGNGDPNTTPRGPFTQFFDYYVLAADNAAAVTIATIVELAEAAQDPKLCKQLAKKKWRGAAKRIARGS